MIYFYNCYILVFNNTDTRKKHLRVHIINLILQLWIVNVVLILLHIELNLKRIRHSWIVFLLILTPTWKRRAAILGVTVLDFGLLGFKPEAFSFIFCAAPAWWFIRCVKAQLKLKLMTCHMSSKHFFNELTRFVWRIIIPKNSLAHDKSYNGAYWLTNIMPILVQVKTLCTISFHRKNGHMHASDP